MTALCARAIRLWLHPFHRTGASQNALIKCKVLHMLCHGVSLTEYFWSQSMRGDAGWKESICYLHGWQ